MSSSTEKRLRSTMKKVRLWASRRETVRATRSTTGTPSAELVQVSDSDASGLLEELLASVEEHLASEKLARQKAKGASAPATNASKAAGRARPSAHLAHESVLTKAPRPHGEGPRYPGIEIDLVGRSTSRVYLRTRGRMALLRAGAGSEEIALFESQVCPDGLMRGYDAMMDVMVRWFTIR